MLLPLLKVLQRSHNSYGGVSLGSKGGILCNDHTFVVYVLLWFNPSQQLNTMEPLTDFPPTQWDGGENQKEKGKLVG